MIQANTIHISQARLKEKWLPSVLVGFYYISLWSPPFIAIPALTWYIALSLAALAALIQGRKLDFQGVKTYFIILLLNFAGAVFSLFRAPFLDEAIWNTIGFAGNIVGYIFFLPVLASRQTRSFILFLHVGVAILWVFSIRDLVSTHGILEYGTFRETGNNKNHIGICLALAAVILIYAAAFIQIGRTWYGAIAKVFIGGGGILILFHLSLIYARSSLLAAILGILSTLFVLVINNRNWLRGVFKGFVAMAITTAIVMAALPNVLSISTAWEKMVFNPEANEAGNTYDDRVLILQKGFYLVGQNPIIGVGIGGGRHGVNTIDKKFTITLMHNSYLADWVDKGILGLISNFVWLGTFLVFVRKKFFRLAVTDQIWMVLSGMIFFTMFFKDLSTLCFTILTIQAGIIYEQKILEQQQSQEEEGDELFQNDENRISLSYPGNQKGV